MSTIHFDPVELEVLRTRLLSIQEEADAVVARTAFGTAITDARDYGSCLTDRRGVSLGGGAQGEAHFAIALAETVKKALALHPVDAWTEGDHLVTTIRGG